MATEPTKQQTLEELGDRIGAAFEQLKGKPLSELRGPSILSHLAAVASNLEAEVFDANSSVRAAHKAAEEAKKAADEALAKAQEAARKAGLIPPIVPEAPKVPAAREQEQQAPPAGTGTDAPPAGEPSKILELPKGEAPPAPPTTPPAKAPENKTKK